MADQPKPIAEGKTKVILADDDAHVLVRSKDDITAGDGAKHDLLEGKAVYSTRTTTNCFQLLTAAGIPTHFAGRVDDHTFRARRADMIPLELVARRIATGSYLKRRPDIAEGTVFGTLIIEFFEKDDTNHDPLAIIDLAGRRMLRYAAAKPLAEGFLSEQSLDDSRFSRLSGPLVLELIDLTTRVFKTLETAWAKQDVALVDLKIECGWAHGTGQLLVADVIDNDSWRIWPAGDKAQMKDKQVYRELARTHDSAAKAKQLSQIQQNYAWVANATAAFVQ